MLICSWVFPGCSWVRNKPVKKKKKLSVVFLWNLLKLTFQLHLWLLPWKHHSNCNSWQSLEVSTLTPFMAGCSFTHSLILWQQVEYQQVRLTYIRDILTLSILLTKKIKDRIQDLFTLVTGIKIIKLLIVSIVPVSETGNF